MSRRKEYLKDFYDQTNEGTGKYLIALAKEGYDVCEFENLFKNKFVEYITTVGTDGSLEALEERTDFSFTDEEFKSYINWHIHFSEKRELLGRNNHLVYICKKK